MSNYFLSTSRRIKSTPFSSRNERAGVSTYTVYNRTLIPTVFKSLEEDYFHLMKNVQLWDVSCQKIIRISGKESKSFLKYLFCRNFNDIKQGKAYYSPIVNFKGGLLNDPVIFCIKDDCFWVSTADSDLFNWISAIAEIKSYQVNVSLPETYSIAVQGPKSKDLMFNIFGDEIKDLKFFNFKSITFNKESFFISRTGFSKQFGYEIIFTNPELGKKIWDLILNKGKNLDIRVGCPNMIERVENNLLSYGNEMTDQDNPFDCGLGKFCNLDTDYEFIGKSALLEQQKIGFNNSIYKVNFNLNELKNPKTFFELPVFYKG